MSIKIDKYTAEGPFFSANQLKDASGVYVILGGQSHQETQWSVVDIGESGNIRNRVASHERDYCWKNQPHNTLGYAAIYTDASNRMQIEQYLRHKYNPPCGQQ